MGCDNAVCTLLISLVELGAVLFIRADSFSVILLERNEEFQVFLDKALNAFTETQLF